ncbi:MAG: SDR family NAD(P)-dependent oxidoreductase, partial [Planctomycetes bacterium]|nr:SDR family NAD(P)-dependent oxidoreductase [Planctomycetota bacterium]
NYCALASVKSNIGHTSGAAGVASVQKVLLSMKHQKLVPSLNCTKENIHFDFKNSPFYINKETKVWETSLNSLRRACVSAFGISGTNAHVVLEEYIAKRSETNSSFEIQIKDPVIIPLSARTKEQLEQRARELFKFLRSSMPLHAKPRNKDSKNQLEGMAQLGEKIEAMLANLLHVEKDRLDSGQSFRDYGVEPIHLTKLFETIRQEYDLELDVDEWIKQDSIESLLHYCLGEEKESPDQSVATTPAVDLKSLAYTLQTGRDAMEERLGFVVTTVQELGEKLETYLAGNQENEECYQGEVKRNNETLAVFSVDEELQEAIEKWIVRKKFPKLLDLWVKGLVFDWNKLYGASKPKRISLPTYPFARDRYWITETQGKGIIAMSGAAVSVIHPLLHENTSGLSEQSFTSTFTGKEFFLNDHQVKGEKVFPGVGYLEMARAAVEKASREIEEGTTIHLKNVVWAQPIVVDGSAQEVHIGLFGDDSGQIQYEVYTESDNEEEAIVHSQGVAKFKEKEETSTLDIEELKAQMNERPLSGEDCYQAFKEMGIEYGEGHRGIREIYLGENQVLARLSLPYSVQESENEYVLHPSLMDSALQSSIGLMLKNSTLSESSETPPGSGRWTLRPSLPFTLASLEIVDPCTSEMYAWVRYSSGSSASEKVQKLDIDLCDEQGNVRVKMRGFSSRTLEGGLGTLKIVQEKNKTHEESIVGLQSFVPVWDPIPIRIKNRVAVSSETKILFLGANYSHLSWIQKSYPHTRLLELSSQSTIEEIQEKLKSFSFDHLLWITPRSSQATDRHSLIEQQEKGVLQVFRIIKSLLNLGYAAKEIEWTIVTNKTQLVKKREPITPTHAGVFGLIGSLAKEFFHWKLRLLDVDSLESVSAQECLSLGWDKQCDGYAYRKREWFKQGLVRVQNFQQEASLYRKEGVYVVIGGAGGIGEVWSRFMMEQYRARIVWIGRREKDSAIEEKIDFFGTSRIKPLYIQADAADLDSLQQAFKKIKATYPKIHGVVHSAIVLKDKSLVKMAESVFRVGLSAKVNVSVNMDRVFGEEELDFMLFFSSMISFAKTPGQSNYAAGCTFKDSFAQMLQQRRSYPVKIMNWGYWGSVGIVTDESYNKRMEQAGIGSIEPWEAMASLQSLVNSKLSQVALIKTLRTQALETFCVREEMSCYDKVSDLVLPQLQKRLPKQDSLKQPSTLEGEQQTETMDSLLREILSATLISMGLFTQGVSRFSDLSLKKQPAPFYEQWLRTSINYLQKEKFLSRECTVTRKVKDLPLLWEEWEEGKTEWMRNRNLKARLVLLETCLKALPDILSGIQLATDVMFPNSSMKLVEGIYQGNPLSDYFNEALGNTLVEAIRQKRKSDKGGMIRILEIGAGTGGTTAKLLPLLEEFSESIEEYCYTDLSKAFLMHAEENYKPGFPALTTSIFDASSPLARQSIDGDHYDFAIAANVLHATPNIRETLRNVKATLKHRGILLLNEISCWSLFAHLTFGLLEGWWLYEDAALRLEGSPGLLPETWQEVLEEEGFESIFFPAKEANKFGQQVIAAGSDGIVRQVVVTKTQSQTNAVSGHYLKSITSIRTIAPQEEYPAEINNQAGNDLLTLGNVTDQMRKDYTRQIITEKFSESLKVELSAIDYDESFADYGLDSITGVNLVQVINTTLQIELETTSLFEHSTVNELTKYILATWEEKITEHLSQYKRILKKGSCLPNKEPSQFKATLKRRFIRKIHLSEEENSFNTKHDSIAIIGMSGRFAQSETLEEFWENLKDGKDLVREVSRWKGSGCVASASLDQEYCSKGGFIDSIALFDPLFFGISPGEATYMDPQQRLFLEESWKALEDAGYAGKSMEGKQCGIYVGCGGSDYSKLFQEKVPAQAFWGNAGSVIPARIAYYLNLHGPAVAIDTACSSSLVSIHLACQGLWSKEIEMGLAGGVFLQSTPGFFQSSNCAGMLSPKGKCHTFDARADGFVPGEGVGVIVLKRLADALQDGDSIRGVIVGSGINQDGRSNGITSPSAKSQERLERSVYDRFKIHPESIQVVEAHGTGTKLGDPIEYEAITRSFRKDTEKTKFCAIGSVKTNIGHTATAAGVAGVLKLVLSLRHRQIPPSLHFREGNQAIDFESSPFYVNTQLKEWKIEENQSRRAAISSFGFSGTNAHMVIEEAPLIPEKTIESPGYLVVLSARTLEQLNQQVRNLLNFCKKRPGLSMNDLSHTLFVGRMHLKHRISCIVRSQKEMIRFMEKWCESETVSQIYYSEIQEGKIREQASLKNYGNQCIEECRSTNDGVQYLEHLATIADLYIQGYSLEFQELFSQYSKKISLPTYPFARERYWISGAQDNLFAVTAKTNVSAIHPLLHENTSYLSEQRFTSIFTGKEFFLNNHKIRGEKVLPGVSYLEMARAAVEKASGETKEGTTIHLKNVVWSQPIVANCSVQKVHIGLYGEDERQIQYEVYTESDSEAELI